ncbi:MAG: hypothetical protein H0U55_03945 [Rubrobacteraceae bacterium]|nr:hypothetical protein [Rubrobacteraceae bacterium]
MRLTALYLRSRLAGYAALIVAAVAVLVWGAPYLQAAARTNAVLVPVLAPLACACVVGAGAHSPFGEHERTAAYPLFGVRVAHLVGLIFWAGLLLVLGTSAAGEEPLRWECARNLGGLSGLAFLAARLVGGRLCWTAPVFYATVAPFVVRGPDETWSWLAWVYRPGSDELSWVVALTLLTAGLVTVSLSQPWAGRGVGFGRDPGAS